MRRFLTALAVLISACASDPEPEPPLVQGEPILEFRLVHPDTVEGSLATRFDDTVLHLDHRPIVSDSDFERVRVERTDTGVQIDFLLNGDAAERLSQTTRENVGERIAVLVRGQVESAPVVQSQIGGQGQLAFEMETADAEALVRVIRARWPE